MMRLRRPLVSTISCLSKTSEAHRILYSTPLHLIPFIDISLYTSIHNIKIQTLYFSYPAGVKDVLGSVLIPCFSFSRSIHSNLDSTHLPTGVDQENPRVASEKLVRDVDKVCKLLSINSSSSIETLLDQASIRVSSSLVFGVLKRISNASVLALSFFRWAEKQNGFSYSTESYNALIDSLGKTKQFRLIWDIVKEMKQKGVLAKDTFALISRRYARARKAREAIDAFEKMEKFGLKYESSDFNRLMDTLVKSRQVDKAQELFDKMRKTRFVPDVKTYTILLEGWGQEKKLSKLNEVYREMKDKGFEPDVVTYGIVIDAHCKAGKCDDAIAIFRDMESKDCQPSPHIFCTLINGLGSQKRLSEAVRYFEQLKARGFSPETPTYNALVGAYCYSEKMDDAYRIVNEMRDRGVGPNSRTYDIILHHLIKAGKTKNAYSVFQEMGDNEGCQPTISTYELMVRMFCNQQRVDMAVKIWDQMKAKGILPGMHSFSTLINSLCHENKLDEACEYFQEMLDMGIRPPAQLFSNLKQTLLDEGKKDTVVLLDRKIERLRKAAFGSGH